jgi:ATP-dependent exoDNAse (exonuclease V) alpha subunit
MVAKTAKTATNVESNVRHSREGLITKDWRHRLYRRRRLRGREVTVAFDGRAVVYGRGELDALVPAYAATIHKGQGSEYPA